MNKKWNKGDIFVFESIVPSCDWYSVTTEKVRYEDYDFFSVEKRFGPGWWVLGVKTEQPCPAHRSTIHRIEKTLGQEVGNAQLTSFIEWNEAQGYNKITDLVSISPALPMFKELREVFLKLDKGENNNE